MKRTMLSIALVTVLSAPVVADNNDWDREAKDAWLDGKAEATLLFNGNLDSFDINTDVAGGTVTLTGMVSNEVDKELAGELIMGIDGVKSVNNKLTVHSMKEHASTDHMANQKGDMDEEYSALTDAKIGTVVKSRFLFNSEISGTDIDVDVSNGIVTLKGEVDSDAKKDLAASIASNANDVKSVKNEIMIKMDKKS